MATNKSPILPTRKRMVFVICVFAIMVCGMLILGWKDIYSEIPKFEQLQEARANAFRPNIERHRLSGRYSIEFFDGSGKRYQTGEMDKGAFDQITAALSANTPVVIRYGPWRTPFPSATIFTVYQLEIDNRVIIPYAELASALQREQARGPLMMFCFVVTVGLMMFIAVRRSMKFQRQLALLKSRSSNEAKS